MTSRSSRVFALACAVSFALPIGCDRTPEPVTIAVALDERNRRGVEIAVSELNARGGIRGAAVRIEATEWVDPGFNDPSATIAWADALTHRQDILGVIGHSDSSSTLAAAGLYNERGLPHLVTIATNPEITRIGPWTYRLCIDDEVQGRLLARHVVEDWGKRRIAVLHVNDDYGRGLAERFQAEVERMGGAIVASVFHEDRLEPRDEEILGALLPTWRDTARPDAIALLARPQSVRRLIPLIRSAGLDTPVIGGDNLALMLTWRETREMMDGARAAAFYAPEPHDAEARRIRSLFVERWDAAPDYSAAFAYDAVQLLARAIERGGFRRQGVRDALDEMIRADEEIDGFGGRYRLGADRNARREMYVVELRDGEVRRVAAYHADRAFSPEPLDHASVETLPD